MKGTLSDMKSYFITSLVKNGLIGGGLLLDDRAVTYKTNKLTVDPKYRNLVLPHEQIASMAWKRILFPIATFQMKNGETYAYLIFNQKRFDRCYAEMTAAQMP